MDARSFKEFHSTWLEKLHLLTTHLSEPTQDRADQDQWTRQIVEKSMAHFSELYRVKSELTDVVALFSAPWDTSLERSLHWVAGFRPTTLFHLIYTESSLRFESQMLNFLRGHRTGDLGELSAGQLTRVSDLQCDTVKKENEISSRLSAWQEELVGIDWGSLCCGDALDGRVERLKKVVEAADILRLDTMKKVVGTLSTRQAAEFILAFCQLLFGIRSWGLHHDRLQLVPSSN